MLLLEHHYHGCENTALLVAREELKIEFKEVADFLFYELERRFDFWLVAKLHHIKTELSRTFNLTL